jgi:tetratricopeptide (TPR) repeat protein
MKKIVLFLMLATAVLAQENKKFVAAMERNIALVNSAKMGADYANASNAFERIANAEPKEWLPLYYQSYALILSANDMTDNMKKDEVYEKAMSVAEKADKLSPENSEIVTLKSWITSMKISIDPMVRGQKLGMEAAMLNSLAISLNPENPRPYFLQGVGTMYTPEQFGGGKEKALPMLEKAVEKFNNFKPINSLMPTWGKERALQMLEECKKM